MITKYTKLELCGSFKFFILFGILSTPAVCVTRQRITLGSDRNGIPWTVCAENRKPSSSGINPINYQALLKDNQLQFFQNQNK